MNSQGCEKQSVNHRELRLVKGFTLIELLVVIAIIALLLSVLLPGLRKAKEAAQSVVCRAHLRGAGMGVTGYINTQNNWLPGPNTSGLNVGMTGRQPVSPSDPVQNVDWISPSLGDELGLMNGLVDRLDSMFNTDLHCPANKVRYNYAYPGTIAGLNPQDLHYSSYSSPIVHHMVHQNAQPSGWVTDVEINSMFVVSKSYQPKQDRVGTPARKIWAMDGARYYDEASDQTSFNDIHYQNDGGNFMLTGPVYNRGGDPFLLDTSSSNPENWELMEPAMRLAYRHNKRINVVFMDGHCETLDLLESLKPTYYFPKDTRITPLGAAVLRAPNVSAGYIR